MEEEQLSEGWQLVKLADVCDIVSGKNQKKVINPIGKYPIYGSSGQFGFADDYLCNEGTTVIGRKGTINTPIFVNTKFWNVDTAFGLSPKSNYNNKLLYYFCRSFNFLKLDKSTTIPSLAKRDLLQIDVPLPPKTIQLQLVSKIEELFSELDKGVEELRKAQQQLKVYQQAVLKWAFEGRLTNQNVKENQLPEGWQKVSVGSICKCIVPNRDKPKSFSGNIKWVTTPNLNIDSIKINYNDIHLGLTMDEVKKYNARVVPINSVIMTCVGTLGLSAIVEQPIVINQQLHAFITNDLIDPKYLCYCIQYNKFYFESRSTSTTIQYLNKDNCNSMPIPLSSIPEQKKVVQEIESRLSVCDKIEETINNSLKEAEVLRQSILKKAFEGKLLGIN